MPRLNFFLPPSEKGHFIELFTMAKKPKAEVYFLGVCGTWAHTLTRNNSNFCQLKEKEREASGVRARSADALGVNVDRPKQNAPKSSFVYDPVKNSPSQAKQQFLNKVRWSVGGEGIA
jgi:hypothetical protein